jgi:hypothetical protein
MMDNVITNNDTLGKLINDLVDDETHFQNMSNNNRECQQLETVNTRSLERN